MIAALALIALMPVQDASDEDHTSLSALTYRCRANTADHEPGFMFAVEGTPRSSRTEISAISGGWPEAPILIRDGLRGTGTLHPEGADIGLFRIKGQSGSDSYSIDLMLTFPKQGADRYQTPSAELVIRGKGQSIAAHCVMASVEARR